MKATCSVIFRFKVSGKGGFLQHLRCDGVEPTSGGLSVLRAFGYAKILALLPSDTPPACAKRRRSGVGLSLASLS